jgi:ankyrin repeat protein
MGKGSKDLSKTLIHSALKGRLHVFKFLLDNGAKVNVSDNTGQTPLMAAASSSNAKIVEFFLMKSASIGSIDFNGMTALHYAAKENEQPSALTCDTVKLLVDNGLDVNARDNEGLTPLHHACKSGSQRLVELFIQLKADIDAKNSAGLTPLELATSNCHTKVWIKERADMQI